MRAATLRHLITIEQSTATVDASGEPDFTWGTYVDRRAEIKALTGTERFEAQQVAAEVDHEITIRFTEGITPKMRVRENGRAFDIHAAFDPTGRREKTVILASEAV